MTWSFHHPTTAAHLEFSVFDSWQEIDRDEWGRLNQKNNLYLSIPYLSALENSLKGKMDFKYIVFYDDEKKAVAFAYVQIIQCVNMTPKSEGFLAKIGDKIRTHILDVLDIRVMVCGNLFANGENGFAYLDTLSEEVAFENLSHALFQIRQAEQNENKQPSALILKEFWPDSFQKAAWFEEHKFREFELDVNMILPIHPEWQHLDDYLGSMVTKFRTKAKACFKKSADIIVKDLSVEEIQQHQKTIATLYANVVESADFHFGELNGDCFVAFKQNLGDQFILKGFFLGDELVGFSTAFVFDRCLEAGYIGLDYNYNYQYAVYQRLLYDYVEQAIERNCTELRLGRTAEEIKSTLGATPVNMKLYVRHRNSLSNKLIKPIVKSITPSEFELRKPFKADFSF